MAVAAELLSEATGHIGPHRWHPMLPELLDRLTQSGDLLVSPKVDTSPSPAHPQPPVPEDDSAQVEQKNGALVRSLIGDDRYASKAAYAQLARVYDRARIPYQRLGATGVLPALRRQELEALYRRLNPLWLRRQLETALERLWTLEALPAPSPAPR